MMFASLSLVIALLSPLAPGVEVGCADVAVIGVSGSGQTGYGEQVEGVVDRIVSEAGSLGLIVDAEPLRYPAVSISDNFGLALFNGDYNRSVSTGAANLNVRLNGLGRDCPSTQIVLVGYSQGAQVIKTAMAGRPPIDRLTSVILLADPSRDTLQTGVLRIGNLDGIGALASDPLAEQIRPLTIDVCALTDAVCSGGGLDFSTHIEGYEATADDVIDRIKRSLQRSLLRFRSAR
jgi:hypothetical protein